MKIVLAFLFCLMFSGGTQATTVYSNAQLAALATTDAPNGVERCGILVANDSPCMMMTANPQSCPAAAFAGTVTTAAGAVTSQLNLTALTSGVVKVGMTLPAPVFQPGTMIVSQLSGTPNGVGVYQLSKSFTPPATLTAVVRGNVNSQVTSANNGCWAGLFPAPAIDFNFLTHTCADYGLTNSRSTNVAYEIGSNGNYAQQTASTCDDHVYSPAGLAQYGLGLWGVHVNNIRNNSGTGASVGTPGTLPTDWTAGVGAVNAGTLAVNVIALSTSNGIDTQDLQLVGTPAGAGVYPICFNPANFANAANGNFFMEDIFLATAAGDFGGITEVDLRFNENNSGGTVIQADDFPIPLNTIFPVASSTYSFQRFFNNFKLTGGASVAKGQSCIAVKYAGANPISWTMRLGWAEHSSSNAGAQLVPPPPIRTTNAAATSNRDVVTIPLANTPLNPAAQEITLAAVYIWPIADNGSQAHVTVVLDDGTGANGEVIETAGNQIPAVVAKANAASSVVASVGVATGTPVSGQMRCMAGVFSVARNVIEPYANGVLGTGVASTGLSGMAALTTLRLGVDANNAGPLYGNLRAVKVWNQALVGSEKAICDQMLAETNAP